MARLSREERFRMKQSQDTIERKCARGAKPEPFDPHKFEDCKIKDVSMPYRFAIDEMQLRSTFFPIPKPDAKGALSWPSLIDLATPKPEPVKHGLLHPDDVARFERHVQMRPQHRPAEGVKPVRSHSYDRNDAEIGYRPFNFEIQDIVVDRVFGVTHVALYCRVADRVDGTDLFITARKKYPYDVSDAWAVRQLVGEFLIHELDECLRYRHTGEHIHDPHTSDLPFEASGIR